MIADQQSETTKAVFSALALMSPIAPGGACVWFYVNNAADKAIFWLLVTVLVKRWGDRVLSDFRRGSRGGDPVRIDKAARQ